jgi:ABC-2 type transport system ATP-binding protein
MTLAIETHDVRKVYKPQRPGEVVALKGLDLEVQQGHVFGFVGPNGAGKTTCIKILSGLAWPSSGQALVFGHPAGSLGARATLGYLPEIANYHDFMSVEELLATHADLAGVARSDRKKACADALEAVSLSHRAKSRIRELSKGMQQRFGIAQALVGNPQLLILDEPTSGLDPLAQKEVKDVIVSLRGRGITIFFSSHKLTEVENICDLIGILHKGRLLRCSPLDALLETGHNVDIRFNGDLRLEGQEEEGEHHRVRVPRERTDATLDAIHGAGGTVYSVTPERLTLEAAFFNAITAADRKESA